MVETELKEAISYIRKLKWMWIFVSLARADPSALIVYTGHTQRGECVPCNGLNSIKVSQENFCVCVCLCVKRLATHSPWTLYYIHSTRFFFFPRSGCCAVRSIEIISLVQAFSSRGPNEIFSALLLIKTLDC